MRLVKMTSGAPSCLISIKYRYIITYGISLYCSTSRVRWAYGQNLMLYILITPGVNGGHSES